MSNNMPKPVITFNQNNLSIDNGLVEKMIQLPSVIKQFEVIDQIIVVRLNPKGVSFLNENEYGDSFEGKVLWQIEKMAHVDRDSHYQDLDHENDLLTVTNWDR